MSTNKPATTVNTKIPIIFEDDDILVIDKPAGIVVNRAASVKGLTVQDWAEEKLGIKKPDVILYNGDDFYNRAGIVHRIDKDTSGLLLIAKSANIFAELQKQFKERAVDKKYLALVHGKMTREGEIKASVGRLPWNRERFGILPGGREAVTSYKLLSFYTYSKDYFSFIRAYPQTGRTHQIRIHLKYIGNPIVSDPFYGGRKTYRDDLNFCPRLFLHAEQLHILHPNTQKDITFEAGLPNDLQSVLDKMKKEN